MDKRNRITTESLRKNFKNQFDLVIYAMKLAENIIKTGRASRIQTEIQNPAVIATEEIASGKDKIDEIPVIQMVKEEVSVRKFNPDAFVNMPQTKKKRKAVLEDSLT